MEILNVNPNFRLKQCCECLNPTEIAYGVEYCKYCGAMFCKDCSDLQYTGSDLNRSNWDCCICAGLTEESGLQGFGVEYCRFCGEELCDYCGLFQVFFVDGEFYTSYSQSRKRPPDYRKPPRVRHRRQKRPTQSSLAEDGLVEEDMGSETIHQVELDEEEDETPQSMEE